MLNFAMQGKWNDVKMFEFHGDYLEKFKMQSQLFISRPRVLTLSSYK